MGRLDDRVILITGGAKGQGAAEAKLAVDEGAHVIVTDVDDDAGQMTAAALGAAYLYLDVSSGANWSAVVEAVVGATGGSTGWSTTQGSSPRRACSTVRRRRTAASSR